MPVEWCTEYHEGKCELTQWACHHDGDANICPLVRMRNQISTLQTQNQSLRQKLKEAEDRIRELEEGPSG